jgi:hypothetical protein
MRALALFTLPTHPELGRRTSYPSERFRQSRFKMQVIPKH